MPVGFPPTESGVEIRLLKKLFTPEEAKIACSMTYAPIASEPFEDIYYKLRSTVESKGVLEKTLDRMVSKGLVTVRQGRSMKFYSNAQWVIGIYEYQVNKLSKEILALISQYNAEAFGSVFQSSSPRQLRVIPVEHSISHQHDVAPYDNIRSLLETAEGPFMVANCVCSEAKKIAGETCKATDRIERCIAAGPSAQMYIDEGWGREITKSELFEILAMNEREGLVLQPSNTKEFHFVCSCCGCCCGVLSGVKASERPIQFFSTNYYATVDHDLCTNCEICTELCQMSAPTFVDDMLTINLNRCIGCGACVANCPSEALSLKKRDEEHVPSETIEELYSRISASK